MGASSCENNVHDALEIAFGGEVQADTIKKKVCYDLTALTSIMFSHPLKVEPLVVDDESGRESNLHLKVIRYEN